MENDIEQEAFAAEATKVSESFASLFDSKDFDWLVANKPHFAHYTSIHALEKILESGEIWFSNPLFMNDYEEMRVGIKLARQIFLNSEEVMNACTTPERHQYCKKLFTDYYNDFDLNHAFNVYVFCLSQIDFKDTDGKLSMWRSYGSNGDGAAIVFNSAFINQTGGAYFIIAKVAYESPEKRIEILQQKLREWCAILKQLDLSDAQLITATYIFFQWCLVFALTTKHHGFIEESEWRIIYLPMIDSMKEQEKNFGYAIGVNGVEPKLKVPVRPYKDPKATWTFESIIDRIILGPSFSTLLAKKSVERMLNNLRPTLADKVVASTIPLRPQSRWFQSEL